jgi:hypothetical protein
MARLPLSSSQRNSARDILVQFGEDVTEFLKNKENTFSEFVVQYGWSVVRSPSTLINRQKRAEILDELLFTVW